MDKIAVSTDGTLSINDTETGMAELTQEKLEELVNAALEDKIEFSLEGESPISKFFKTIQDATTAGAKFRTEIDALKAGEAVGVAIDSKTDASISEISVDDEDIPF